MHVNKSGVFMAEFQYHIVKSCATPSKLVVFLHGYTSNAQDVIPYAETLGQHLDNVVIVVPEADMVSERRPDKKQWYALTDIDPDKLRRNPQTSTADIIEIYNRAGPRISAVAKRINRFINELQKKYHIANKQTYILGFSQGAMIAIYAGLTRRYQLGGIFPFAGIVCGKDLLEKELSSYPEVYLFHGTSDLSVQYKTLEFTKDWLQNHNVDWVAMEYDGIEHKLIEDEMIDAAEIIKHSR
jgi:phospholipase/carboxylesterase